MNYYLLTFSANGSKIPAYYGVLVASGPTFYETGSKLSPTALGPANIVSSDNYMTISSPAGSVTGSASIATTAKTIDGQVQANPAVNVDVVVTLSGMTTSQQYVLPAGQTMGSFSFDVSDDDALTQEAAKSRLDETRRDDLQA